MYRTPVLSLLFALALLFGAQSVFAQEDVTGPIVHRVWAVPNRINTTDRPQEITLYFEITDDMSGFRGLTSLATTLQSNTNYGFWTRLTGQPNIYAADWTVPQYSKYGEHSLTWLHVSDEVGNSSESRPGVCNSGLVDYSVCAPWLDIPLFVNDPDYKEPRLHLPLLVVD